MSAIFLARLDNLGLDVEDLDERKVVNEIRNAIPRGIVLFNYQSEDTHNPLDRQIEVYTYIDLSKIDPEFHKIAKLKILCRLSIMQGSLSIRTIQKTFEVS